MDRRKRGVSDGGGAPVSGGSVSLARKLDERASAADKDPLAKRGAPAAAAVLARA